MGNRRADKAVSFDPSDAAGSQVVDRRRQAGRQPSTSEVRYEGAANRPCTEGNLCRIAGCEAHASFPPWKGLPALGAIAACGELRELSRQRLRVPSQST